MRTFINPVADIGSLLLGVEKPGRYVGGEYGRLAKKEAALQTLIAFPDLYEIGMSNQALRIIYNALNRIPDISCDRAFAPAPDFEKLLKEKSLPLYGLDTGIAVKDLDILLFTMGYELGFAGVLSMLAASGMALRCSGRGNDDPVVIAGGPAVSNPLPYSNFIDAFWIGEAEAGFFDLACELREIKKTAVDRAEARAAMLQRLKEHPSVWVKGKGRAQRAVYSGFGSGTAEAAVFPVSSMKVVHQHGILEIMRGCPNGCRFCHAGFWYRPMRQKNMETLVREAGEFAVLGGYSQISLSSLSSGDYSGIGELVDNLNSKFSGRHVSFQLPSLRVSSFSLSLLEKISRTRKSGLTFAVETPLDFWQMALNKQVSEDYVVQILHEAKRNGWRGAKFYFMIGLPLPETETEGRKLCEEEEIVNFIFNVARRTSMHFNINVGIFVPKPHTPYQWARQLDSESAAAKLDFIKGRLKPKGHKVSVSDPLVSMIEGVLSRGDERAGDMAQQAFYGGSRLDAWQEYIAKDVWQKTLLENSGIAGEFLGEKKPGCDLVWDCVSSGISASYLCREFEKSIRGELSQNCAQKCGEACGVCGKDTGITQNTVTQNPEDANAKTAVIPPNYDPDVWRMLFSFTKEGSAVFHGHLSLIEVFSMAMARAKLDVLYTQGFNPLVKLEIVSPLSLGISAGAEIAAADFAAEVLPGEFTEKINAVLPEGICVKQAQCYRIRSGSRKHSLSSLLWGFAYGRDGEETEYVPAGGEKAYREKALAAGGTVFSLRRSCVLAKNIGTATGETGVPWASYFDMYRLLYRQDEVSGRDQGALNPV